ncbi:MAG: DUF5362 family protein [Ferruginibacter sp.]
MEQSENLLGTNLQIDEISYQHLNETAKWAKFISILGFILSAFILLVGIFSASFLSMMKDTAPISPMLSTGVLTIVYAIFATINGLLSLFLFKFSVKMKTALMTNDQGTLNESFLNLKYLYRMVGIIMIAYLAIIVLSMVVGIFAVVSR